MINKKRANSFAFFVFGLFGVVTLPLLPPHFSPFSILGVIHGTMSGIGRTLYKVRQPVSAGVVSLVVLGTGSIIRGEPIFQRNLLSILSLLFIVISCSAFCRGQIGRMVLMTSGFAFGWIFWVLIFPTRFTSMGPEFLWKYGIATPVTVLVACLAIRFRWSPFVQALLLWVLGLFSIFVNFRSHGIVCLLAGVIVVTKSIWKPNRTGRWTRRVLSIGLLGLMLVPIAVLPQAMKSGYFGTTVQQKTIEQADSGPLFFAGRNEPPLAFEIISRAPLTGWGSLENVPDSVVQDAVSLTVKLGMTNQDEIYSGWYRNGNAVDLHSVITSYWAEGGFFAIAFPMFILFVAWRALVRCAGQYCVLICYVGLQVIWDCLFSPFDNYTIRFWGYASVLLLWSGDRILSNSSHHSLTGIFRRDVKSV